MVPSHGLGSAALVAPMLLALAALGCSDDVDAPPVNASIHNEARPLVPGCYTLPFEVICDGPAEELALLDGVCGAKTDFLDWSRTDAPAGMGTWIGPRNGPLFLLFNRLEREPGEQEDVAEELRYSAYFVNRGFSDDIVETLEQWHAGEGVKSGSVITFAARFVACSMSWEGEGTFRWRSTTIEFAWTAAEPC
jgi:hypothetical protein